LCKGYATEILGPGFSTGVLFLPEFTQEPSWAASDPDFRSQKPDILRKDRLGRAGRICPVGLRGKVFHKICIFFHIAKEKYA